MQQLMDDALSSGCTRADLARLAGCSRMQLWRLHTKDNAEFTPSGMRLRAALEGDEFQRIMAQVMESARRLAGGDPKRASALRDMLHNVTDLVSEAKQ